MITSDHPQLSTIVETFKRSDGRYDFRIISGDSGDTLCSSNQGYEHEYAAARIAERVVRAGTMGTVTFRADS